ncbi:MAG: hypothetical protein M9894_19405 [Planctomycetes bacterium]|nr:hypothetical protein [Planctomycetota bacterium]
MDHDLRLLERRAALGDAAALVALQHARRRCGRGWQGEPLHPRMLLGPRPPLYLYDPGKGHRIEMVWVPPTDDARGFWISRGPIGWPLFVTYCRATGAPAPPRGASAFSLAQARAYARWAGLKLPTPAELARAGAWSACTATAPPPAFHVVLRAPRA